MKSYIRPLLFLLFLALAALLFAQSRQGSGRAAEASSAAFPTLPAKMDYAELAARLAEPGNGILLLDVRTAEEFAAGHLPEARLAPYDGLEATFREGDKGRPIVVYCRSGRRSAIAATTLRRMGYANVSDFGAMDRWRGPLAR